ELVGACSHRFVLWSGCGTLCHSHSGTVWSFVRARVDRRELASPMYCPLCSRVRSRRGRVRGRFAGPAICSGTRGGRSRGVVPASSDQPVGALWLGTGRAALL